MLGSMNPRWKDLSEELRRICDPELPRCYSDPSLSLGTLEESVIK